jgi:hypothetical protein
MKYIVLVKNPGSYQTFSEYGKPLGNPRPADPIERIITADGYKCGGYAESRYFAFYESKLGEQSRDVYLVPIDSVIDVRIKEDDAE